MNTVKKRLTVFLITLVSSMGLTLILFPQDTKAQSRATPSDAEAPAHASPSDITAIDDGILPPEDETLYNFSIRKIGADGILYGAVFRLYNSLADANDGINPIRFILDDEEPIYTACQALECPALSDATRDIMAGVAFIEGLPAGTYYLAEIAAPEGYQILHYPYQVVLSDDGYVYYTQVMSGDYLREALGGQIVIGNYAMVLMPGTGGKGANLFYIAGAGCILMALFIVLKMKRR